MSGRQTNSRLQNTCPACNTRLRISQPEASTAEFACPECRSALVARASANGNISVSTLDKAPEVGPLARQSVSLIWQRVFGNSQTLAAVTTASIGLFLAIILLPPIGEPDHSTDHRLTEHGDASDATVIANSESSEQQATEGTNENSNKTPNEAATAIGAVNFQPPSKPEAGTNPTGKSPENTATTPAQTTVADLNSSATADFPSSPIKSKTGAEDGTVQLVAGTKKSASQPDRSGSRDTDEQSPKPEETIATRPAEPPAKPMSIPQRLGISIRSFRISKPVPLRELIHTVEQMCRVRVDVSAVSQKQLASELTVSLTKTSPSGILAEAGRKCGLRVIVSENTVRLVSED